MAATSPNSSSTSRASIPSATAWCCVSLSPPPSERRFADCSNALRSGAPRDQQQGSKGSKPSESPKLRRYSIFREKEKPPDSSQRGTTARESKAQDCDQQDPHCGKESKPVDNSSSGTRRDQQRNEKLKVEEIRKSVDLLKSGEISNLIKQGFIERTQSVPTSRRRLSPGRVSPLLDPVASLDTMAMAFSTFGKANSVLNAGLYAGPPASSSPARASSTLLEMIEKDPDMHPKQTGSHIPHLYNGTTSSKAVERQRSTWEGLGCSQLGGNSGKLFNEAESSDVTLTLCGKNSRTLTLHLHTRILSEKSKFFAAKLSEVCSKQTSAPYLLEVSDCDDLESYQATLQLLYSRDARTTLVKCNVSGVLGILKVSALIFFEAGIVSCLEYLEAVPWTEEEEEKVSGVLSQLQLENFETADVLRRLHHSHDKGDSEEVLVRLLQMVSKGKDEKARREMKALVSRMLRENIEQNRSCVDVSKESLYCACATCLDSLLHLFMQGTKTDFMNQGNEDRGMLVSQIARQADNLLWLLEILIDRQISDDFVKMWAHQSELASLHKQLATMLRYEVSRVTARLCVAIGKGQVLCSMDVRYMLLQTWLPPLVDDFGWMQRGCKGLDKLVVEEGISNTILTLPLKQQQSILLAWFDRFSNNGDDCPNLQKAFEVWWRRTFVKPSSEDGAQFSRLP